jgi:hypothetical protein
MPDRNDNTVSWVVDGTQYDVDLHDIDGVEWRDITRATGLLQTAVMRQALIAKEFDAIGALIWIVRRRAEAGLTYETVLRTLSYRSFSETKEEPTSPPDSGG